MTNEEAYKILKNSECFGAVELYHKDEIEAFNVALEALKAEPCEDELDFVQPHEKIPVTLDLNKSCKDAVSREAVLKKIFLAETSPIGSDNILKELSYSVENMPSVTPKQRTGKWIHHEDIIGLGGYYCCSCCDKRALYHKSETAWINTPTRYCPNCGAKMEGESE